MNSPTDPRDGAPFVGDIIAVVDESGAPSGGAVGFVLAAAVVFAPIADIELALTTAVFTTGRKRPFHWLHEGVEKRSAVIEIVCEHGMAMHVRYRWCGRKGQASARRDLLATTSELLTNEGVTHLAIEHGDHSTNQRDHRTLLDRHQLKGGVPFEYDWRSKAQPVMWLGDAVAGAVSEHLTNKASMWYERLNSTGLLTLESL